MDTILILGRSDAARPEAERLMRDVFWARYGATLSTFPEKLVVRIDRFGRLACAAGLRFASDGFFSESYLDEPVEQVIGRRFGHRPARERIFEVSSLASRDASRSMPFVFDIIRYGQSNGFEWAFFTLTWRLSRILLRLGVAPQWLADADKQRIPGFQTWGSYYDQTPGVFALPNPDSLPSLYLKTESQNAHLL